MADALAAAKRPVPRYLQLAVAEYASEKPETATFAMHCFWVGQARLGMADGVIAVRAAFFKGAGEVVELTYDAERVDYKTLVGKASEMQCTSRIIARTDEQQAIAAALIGKERVIRSDAPVRDAPRDTHYHLRRRPECFFLPLTQLQAACLNGAIGSKRFPPDPFLSPTQLALKARLGTVGKEELLASGLVPLRAPEGERNAGGIASYHRQLVQWLDSR